MRELHQSMQCRINANRGPFYLPKPPYLRETKTSHSSRYDMMAIISSRYQYGPFLFFCCRSYVKLLDYWRAEKNVSTSGAPPPWDLRPVAFATSATWLTRHWVDVPNGLRLTTPAVPVIRRLNADGARHDDIVLVTISHESAGAL